MKQIEHANTEVLNNIEDYRIKHRTMANAFTEHHSQLKLSEQHLQRLTETLSNQLTSLSERFSQYQKACPTTGGSSRLKRYLTPTVVGIISALLTNLILWIAFYRKFYPKRSELIGNFSALTRASRKFRPTAGNPKHLL